MSFGSDDVAEFQSHARALAHKYKPFGGGGDGQDVFQEAMIAAWRALQKYDGRGDRAGYVRLQMKRRVIEFIRVRSNGEIVAPPKMVGLEEWSAHGPDTTVKTVLERERLRIVVETINGLPRLQRARLVGRAEGRSIREMAAADGLTVNSIDQLLYRGRRMLKLALAA